MRFTFWINWFFIFLSAGFLFSCGTPKPLEYKNYQNLVIEKIGFNSSLVRMDIVYYNPNNFGLQLKHTDLNLYVNGNFLGHTEQEYQITIPKRDNFSIPIQLSIDMKNIFKNAFQSFLTQQVTVRASGTVTVGKANLFINFPVNYESIQNFRIY